MNEMKSILDNFLLNVFTQLVERDVLMYTQLPDWFQRGLQNLKSKSSMPSTSSKVRVLCPLPPQK